MSERYLEPTQESGAALFSRTITGEVVMLNLLRFRTVADYMATPDLAPGETLTGKEAYQLYIDHTLPLLRKSGGDLVFIGNGGKYLIGPHDAHWDLVMLVRHKSVEVFMGFASDEKYLAGIGHRTAALDDSRLLPIVEIKEGNPSGVSI